ncbi:MAG: sigma 54-interacting transcriptional regulator [Terrisporobacter sp.]
MSLVSAEVYSKYAYEFMSREFSTIEENKTLLDAIDLIINKNERRIIVVDNKNNMKGIISITDVCLASKKNKYYKDLIIKDVMTRKIIEAKKFSSLDRCRELMIKNNISVLPILEDKKVIGIVTKNQSEDVFHEELISNGFTSKVIIDEIKEGICVINKDGIVILWNKFMEDKYNIYSSEIVGNHIEEFLKNTIIYKSLLSRKRESGIYAYEGVESYGSIDANPIYIDSHIIGVVCTEMDITEVRKLSLDLEKAESKLEFLKEEVKNLSSTSFDGLIGKNYKLEKCKEMGKRIAKTQSSILIYGESGTGKEILARAIHDYSERKGQFIAVNCSAIPSELFESEFFGYESGSFTGANKKGKMGIFELAKEGTIFLDEIGDLPIAMQAKLLRVIQEKEVRRIGGERTIKIDVRIISATNKDLNTLVLDKKFRDDLYYRLNVVQINLPSLRERKDDIPILINTFMREICGLYNKESIEISKEALVILQKYNWQGNIRELRNTVESLIVLSKNNMIEKENIPQFILDKCDISTNENEHSLDLNIETEKFETKIIKKALQMSDGNKSKAAKILNVPRTTLYYKIEQYNININEIMTKN